MVKEHTILVVDDDEDICEALRGYLEDEGYRVLIAEDGRKALGLLEHERVDLIILDLMMPSMSGFEMVEELQRRGNRARYRILYMTAFSDTQVRERIIETQPDNFLFKPFLHMDSVAREVAHLLEGK